MFSKLLYRWVRACHVCSGLNGITDIHSCCENYKTQKCFFWSCCLKFILKCTKLYSCLKCSLIIAKRKILFLNFICLPYNFGEVYNIVLLTNNCDLFILLKVFLANETHLLLLVSSPMQTRLFWWDSVRFMLLRNELVGTDKRNETEN